MNKQDAAAFLGAPGEPVSERTVERLAAKGRIRKTMQMMPTSDGRKREVADYNDEDLATVKAEDAQPKPQAQLMRLAADPGEQLALRTALPELIERIMDGQRSITLEAINLIAMRPTLDQLNFKLTLSLSEAAQIAGLSRSFLRAAIETGKLKAEKRGRGWNIKRADLDSFIKKL